MTWDTNAVVEENERLKAEVATLKKQLEAEPDAANWPLVAAVFAEQALENSRMNISSIIDNVARKNIRGLRKSTLWSKWTKMQQVAGKEGIDLPGKNVPDKE